MKITSFQIPSLWPTPCSPRFSLAKRTRIRRARRSRFSLATNSFSNCLPPSIGIYEKRSTTWSSMTTLESRTCLGILIFRCDIKKCVIVVLVLSWAPTWLTQSHTDRLGSYRRATGDSWSSTICLESATVTGWYVTTCHVGDSRWLLPIFGWRQPSIS